MRHDGLTGRKRTEGTRQKEILGLEKYKSHLEFGQVKVLEARGYHHSPRSKLGFLQTQILEASGYHHSPRSKSDLD